MRARFLLPAVFLMVLTIAAPAYALDPPTTPQAVTPTDSFEAALPASWTITETGWPLPSPTVWGRINQIHSGSTGTYSLWCAGNPSYWPTYPDSSASDAVLDVDLSAWYSATIGFDYLMPSKGAADVFAMGWKSDADYSYDTRGPYGLTTTSVWLTNTYSLTSDTSRNLSRKSGEVKFRWADGTESLLQHPTLGQGPAIDLVKLLGYRYGPVRALASSQGVGYIGLSWSKPLAATDSAVADSRTINYRVWRRLETSPSGPWTELTAAAMVPDSGETVSYQDATAQDGVSYVYRVVPYTPASTTDYGEASEVTGRLPVQGGIDVAASASPYEIVAGDSTTLSYTVTNTGGTTLTNIVVTDSLGVLIDPAIPASLAPSASFVAHRSWSPSASGTNDVSVTADGATDPAASSVYITVYHPAITVTMSPSTRWANSGKLAYWDIAIQNTGDIPVSGLVIKLKGVAVGSLQTLAVGQTAVVPVSQAVSQSGAVACSVTAGLSVGGVARQVSDDTSQMAQVVTSRLAGSSRIDTAILASKAAFSSAPAVVIATGYGFPDALSAGALAGAVNGPLLLVNKTTSTAAVLAEINRLKATTAYIVGGTGVVSDAVRNEIASRTTAKTVTRISGSNRYATAEAVAANVKALSGTPTTAFLVTGANFPDALAASSLSANQAWPILLTEQAALPAQTDAALRNLKPKTVVICGGTAVVSSAVEKAVAGNAAYGSPTVVRMPGLDRYDTAKRLIDWGIGKGLSPADGIDGYYLATGSDYPDALAGGVLAGLSRPDGKWRPLMLTAATTLTPKAVDLNEENGHIGFVTVLGGTTAVSDGVRTSALNLIP